MTVRAIKINLVLMILTGISAVVLSLVFYDWKLLLILFLGQWSSNIQGSLGNVTGRGK